MLESYTPSKRSGGGLKVQIAIVLSLSNGPREKNCSPLNCEFVHIHIRLIQDLHDDEGD